ncbi:unnamed protein product [Paramecium sonneborni]|uniref:Uncharacterized protein n=1 Tax=Paramecium sonneborni TaxID=65129 RepID=A0A8S1MM58_9CILI|nr:unnamed protein product [Paramecium sonneborni]
MEIISWWYILSIIILHMKQDNLEFLEEKRVKDLVKKHSEFIGFSIELQIGKKNREGSQQ